MCQVSSTSYVLSLWNYCTYLDLHTGFHFSTAKVERFVMAYIAGDMLNLVGEGKGVLGGGEGRQYDLRLLWCSSTSFISFLV